jgi:hypothetical protein
MAAKAFTLSEWQRKRLLLRERGRANKIPKVSIKMLTED